MRGMSIPFTCANPECGKSLSAPDTAAGKKVRCPQCGSVCEIPAARPAGGSPFAVAGQAPEPSKPVKAARKPKAKSNRPGIDFSGFVAKGIAVAVLGALIVGAIIVLPMTCSATKKAVDYTIEQPFQVKHTAENMVAQNNLVLIRDAIRQFQVETGEYPLTLDDLVSKRLITPMALKPSANGQPYQYINHQRDDMPESNILVYEEKPTAGMCMVLRRGGAIESLTPDQLKAQLDQTYRSAAPAP